MRRSALGEPVRVRSDQAVIEHVLQVVSALALMGSIGWLIAVAEAVCVHIKSLRCVEDAREQWAGTGDDE